MKSLGKKGPFFYAANIVDGSPGGKTLIHTVTLETFEMVNGSDDEQSTFKIFDPTLPEFAGLLKFIKANEKNQ